MAQRRMFSPEIVCSDAFLAMPVSVRELYFQLGMKADDDGFVNPRMVMRITGASEDDLSMLFVRRFALPFKSGVIVIKHWKINNLVRKDWYKPTLYTEEKKGLITKENGAYTEVVNGSLTVRTHRLDRLDRTLGAIAPVLEVKETISKPEKKDTSYLSIFALWGSYPMNWRKNRTEIDAAKNLLAEKGLVPCKEALSFATRHKDEIYCPKIRKPSDLDRKWLELKDYEPA